MPDLLPHVQGANERIVATKRNTKRCDRIASCDILRSLDTRTHPTLKSCPNAYSSDQRQVLHDISRFRVVRTTDLLRDHDMPSAWRGHFASPQRGPIRASPLRAGAFSRQANCQTPGPRYIAASRAAVGHSDQPCALGHDWSMVLRAFAHVDGKQSSKLLVRF